MTVIFWAWTSVLTCFVHVIHGVLVFLCIRKIVLIGWAFIQAHHGWVAMARGHRDEQTQNRRANSTQVCLS